MIQLKKKKISAKQRFIQQVKKDPILQAFMQAVSLALATGYPPGIRCVYDLFSTCMTVSRNRLPVGVKTEIGIHRIALQGVPATYKGRTPRAMRYWRELAADAQLSILADASVDHSTTHMRLYAMKPFAKIVLGLLKKDGDQVVIRPEGVPFLQEVVRRAARCAKKGSFCDPELFARIDSDPARFVTLAMRHQVQMNALMV